jgi:hypothetical protein
MILCKIKNRTYSYQFQFFTKYLPLGADALTITFSCAVLTGVTFLAGNFDDPM